MKKEYFTDNISVETLAKLVDETLKHERNIKNERGNRKMNNIMLKIGSAVAVFALIIGGIKLLPLFVHNTNTLPENDTDVNLVATKPSDSIEATEKATDAVNTTTDGDIIPDYIIINGEHISTKETSLVLYSAQITDADIKQLSYMVNLTHLRLMDNQICDISPLAGLTNLTYLNLAKNQVYDISPLAGLTNLTVLNLWNNQISDISPLAELTNLTYLYLCENEISDISPLAELANLTELHLDLNQISEIDILAKLTNLTGLNLSGNPINDDMGVLANLINLKYLFLDNSFSDISTLANLKNLEFLYLADNTLITSEQIEELKIALPNTRIDTEKK